MKHLLHSLMAVLSVTAITAFASSPDLADRVLIMYKLTPEQAASFSATDGALSGFWGEWDSQNAGGLQRDYIDMKSDNATVAWNRCATSPFAGADDAQFELRAAYTDAAAYFYCKVSDNNWVDYTGWATDAVDLYIDALNSTDPSGIQDPANYFNPTQWALTFSSKQIQVGMGSSTPITGYNLRFYDDLAMTVTDHTALFGEATYDGMTMEISSPTTNVKIQEWMVPMSQWGALSTAEGTTVGFTGGYNDIDNDAPDCVNSLRWVGLCDPYCEPPNPATWGDAEFGPALGTGGSKVVPNHFNMNRNAPIVKKTDFYTVRGEKINGSAKAGSLLIKREVLANGNVKAGMIGR
jgi:hypothetical protein